MARSQCRWECPEQWSEWQRLAGSWHARSQPLAIASLADGHALGKWSAHGDHLAVSRRSQRRLPRLLLLPYQCPALSEKSRSPAGF